MLGGPEELVRRGNYICKGNIGIGGIIMEEENYIIVKADGLMKEDEIKKLEEQLRYAKFGIAMHDMTIISENALKSQVGKKVPLVWRCDKDPYVIGTAEISSEEDGIKATCKLNGETYEDYICSNLKWYEKLIRRIKKW